MKKLVSYYQIVFTPLFFFFHSHPSCLLIVLGIVRYSIARFYMQWHHWAQSILKTSSFCSSCMKKIICWISWHKPFLWSDCLAKKNQLFKKVVVACLGQRRKKYEKIDVWSCKSSTLFTQRIVRNITILKGQNSCLVWKGKEHLWKTKKKFLKKGNRNLKKWKMQGKIQKFKNKSQKWEENGGWDCALWYYL